jgi:hypothetical protein
MFAACLSECLDLGDAVGGNAEYNNVYIILTAITTTCVIDRSRFFGCKK